MSIEFNPDTHRDAMMQELTPSTSIIWGDSPYTKTAMEQQLMNEQARARLAGMDIVKGNLGSMGATLVAGNQYTDPARTHFTVREIGNGFTVSQGDTELYAADLADVGNKVVALMAAKKMKEK